MIQKVSPIHLKTIDSTNNWAKTHYNTFNLETITRITADEQTQGRGQFNRPWISPKGLNVYLTYFFTVDKKRVAVGNLPQILAISLSTLLNTQGLTPQIKWPNDILVGKKKIAGILCETIDLSVQFGVVLGIGINVNMPIEQLNHIDQPATSLLNETGKMYATSDIIRQLDTVFIHDLDQYVMSGFSPFHDTYNNLLLYKGEPITIHTTTATIHGKLHAITHDGRLTLLLPSGEFQTIHSGELAHDLPL